MHAETHLALVHKIARDYASPGTAFYEDLIGDGSVGLVIADRKYDPTRGIPFASFAAVYVRGQMIDGMRRLRHCAPIDGIDVACNAAGPHELAVATDLVSRVIASCTPRDRPLVHRLLCGSSARDVARHYGVTDAAITHRRKRIRARIAA